MILYTNGDSWSFGTELDLETRSKNRYSSIISKEKNMVDFNISTSGASNDRIVRTTLRDISLIQNGKDIWSENTQNINVSLDDLYVVIGWTSPTRFEYYNEELNQWKQMRHDVEDGWGFKPGDRDYDDTKLKDRFGSIKGMYSKWLSNVLLLHHTLNSLNIKHLFFNAFYPMKDNVSKIVQEFSEIDYITNGREKWDDFDNHNDYFGLLPMWNSCPKSFKSFNSYHFLTSQQYLYDDDLIGEYKHPTEKGHELIAKKILELF